MPPTHADIAYRLTTETQVIATNMHVIREIFHQVDNGIGDENQ